MQSNIPQQLAANVRAEMARRQVQIKDLAPAIGMTPDALSKRLRGLVLISTPELGLIADQLGLTFWDLTGSAASNSGPHSVSPAPAGESGSRERLDRPAASDKASA